ncbi:hypothetical protein [Undibacterium sp. Ren11W]|uniref:hypothetical protein n=1 Tax=Undibacterium sp. Ren11W TaxID=3413045 RepID=UPI003BF233A9
MNTEDQPAASLTPEQAALLAHVTKVESEITPDIDLHDEHGNPVPPEPTLEDAAAENAAILSVLLTMLAPAMPFLDKCYPPEVVDHIAGAYTAVEVKHGWNARQYLSVEVQLAIVALPPTILAFALGKKYFESKRAQEATDVTPRGNDGSNE